MSTIRFKLLSGDGQIQNTEKKGKLPLSRQRNGIMWAWYEKGGDVSKSDKSFCDFQVWVFFASIRWTRGTMWQWCEYVSREMEVSVTWKWGWWVFLTEMIRKLGKVGENWQKFQAHDHFILEH